MRVAVSGASGLVGTAVVQALRRDGHDVLRLVRSREATAADTIYWSVVNREIEATKLDNTDAIVHLAGESIGSGRWTEGMRRRIYNSRVAGTRLLVSALEQLQKRPTVLLSASAIGYYGNTRDRWVDEDAPQGEGFLAKVCGDWEKEAARAEALGVRVVCSRMGHVLSAHGGLLPRLLPLFRAGLGARLGDGRQYFSWVALADVVRAIARALTDETLSGPVNVNAPEPVTNRELTLVLAKLMHRPRFLPAPAFGLRAVLGGQRAEELLLWGQRVWPRKLQEAGFPWLYRDLETALRATLQLAPRAEGEQRVSGP